MSVPYRTLGRTGQSVSAIGVGGWHLGLPAVSESLSLTIVRSALDRGINFLDNSWDYNDGLSETRMGKALQDGYRQKAFLMTKIDGRSKAEAAKQLDQSLKRLQTDCIDLVQHHEVIRFDDPHRIFDPDGAQAALLEGRQAGKLRFIAFHRAQESARASAHARCRARPRVQLRACWQRRQRRPRTASSSRSRRRRSSTPRPNTLSGWAPSAIGSGN